VVPAVPGEDDFESVTELFFGLWGASDVIASPFSGRFGAASCQPCSRGNQNTGRVADTIFAQECAPVILSSNSAGCGSVVGASVFDALGGVDYEYLAAVMTKGSPTHGREQDLSAER
jgi:hypothetical protein